MVFIGDIRQINMKPKIFTYTAYRLPNTKDINEINSANLSSEELFNGFSYTIIGRGVADNESKTKIIEAIKLMIQSNPTNEKYKKALEMAKNMKGKFITEINTIKGGKADKMSAEDIAKKFNVSVDKIKAQIKKGVEIEKEHTNDKEKATEIAMDHVTEFPDYYDRIEKMEKSAKEKWGVSESSKTFIKRLLREGLEQMFDENYFKTRVPFLKDFKFFKHDRDPSRVEAQKVSYHENVKKMFNDEIIVFPQFNVSSEFIFYKQKIGDNVFYNFILKNDFHIMQPKNIDDLTFKVLVMATKQITKKLSYQKEIMVKEGEQLKQSDLNEIINQLNKKMFEVEEITSNNNTPLF